MISGLNTKDNNDAGNLDTKIGNKGAHEEALNEKSIDFKK